MDIVEESAARIKNRETTDTIELVDDIRYYLSQRYGIYLEMEAEERKEELRGQKVETDIYDDGNPWQLTEFEMAYNVTERYPFYFVLTFVA